MCLLIIQPVHVPFLERTKNRTVAVEDIRSATSEDSLERIAQDGIDFLDELLDCITLKSNPDNQMPTTAILDNENVEVDTTVDD